MALRVSATECDPLREAERCHSAAGGNTRIDRRLAAELDRGVAHSWLNCSAVKSGTRFGVQ
jgi:hypothetical protein